MLRAGKVGIYLVRITKVKVAVLPGEGAPLSLVTAKLFTKGFA